MPNSTKAIADNYQIYARQMQAFVERAKANKNTSISAKYDDSTHKTTLTIYTVGATFKIIYEAGKIRTLANGSDKAPEKFKEEIRLFALPAKDLEKLVDLKF